MRATLSLWALAPRTLPKPLKIDASAGEVRLSESLLNKSTHGKYGVLRPLTPFPKFFVNYMMKGGRKELAENIFDDALAILRQRTGADPLPLVEQAVDVVKPSSVLRQKILGRESILIPCGIEERHRRRIGIKWVIEASKERRDARKAGERLANEVLGILAGKSAALERKKALHQLCYLNRANAHYRW